ncbi:fimbrial protein [Bacteroides sp.]|uniref:fimbrial protein n=1 Tax=Bacteroides sp. TaxID=29523 RepID=UPI0035295E5A
MKKINLLAVALAAFTMFSCSNEEIADLGSNAPGEKATLTIKVEGSGNNVAQSRAAGSASTSDVTINDYVVFIFRDGGALDCPAYYSSSNATATISNGTTAAKTAYVIANTGVLASGPFANVTTEAELKAVTGDLMSGNNAATQTEDNLWMSGTNNVAFNGTDGSVTVQLGFVAAKIELIVKDERTNLAGGAIEIADENVVLLYAGKSGNFFGTEVEKTTQTAFYSGDVAYTGFSNGSSVTESTALKDAVSPAFTDNAGSVVFNHFYTFGNDGATNPTILAIQSKKTIGSNTETIYYPVQFTIGDAGYTIEPGKHYTVTLTLKGDVNAGGGGGTTNPEQPLVSSQISVEVKAATWITRTVSKEFN